MVRLSLIGLSALLLVACSPSPAPSAAVSTADTASTDARATPNLVPAELLAAMAKEAQGVRPVQNAITKTLN